MVKATTQSPKKPMFTASLWTVLTGLVIFAGVTHCQDRVVCYWSSWSTYRTEPGNFEVADFDPSICTHAMYHTSLVDQVTYSLIPGDAYNDLEENGGKGNYQKFNAMKEQNPNLKTMLSCQAAATTFSLMSSNADNRAAFVQSVVSYLPQYGFDGLEINWFYPQSYDQENYILLLSELRSAFDVYGFILSAQVPSSQTVVESNYQDVPGMASALDFFNVMTYDFHGSWDAVTGHHSQLRSTDSFADPFNVVDTMENWYTQGASRAQLNVGVPCYGRGYVLVDPASNGLGAAAAGGLPPASYSQSEGMWFDFELCSSMNSSTWETVYDASVAAPYSYYDILWIGHDDQQSAIEKANFIVSTGYGGSYVFSVDSCDFRDTCGGGKFPIIQGLYDTLVSKRQVPHHPGAVRHPR